MIGSSFNILRHSPGDFRDHVNADRHLMGDENVQRLATQADHTVLGDLLAFPPGLAQFPGTAIHRVGSAERAESEPFHLPAVPAGRVEQPFADDAEAFAVQGQGTQLRVHVMVAVDEEH
ncbi:MAG: hypothetical protein M3017_05605 [Actinomycetota bacterium]|nr:hypothetical protein [Actinomycetota bacterium]